MMEVLVIYKDRTTMTFEDVRSYEFKINHITIQFEHGQPIFLNIEEVLAIGDIQNFGDIGE